MDIMFKDNDPTPVQKHKILLTLTVNKSYKNSDEMDIIFKDNDFKKEWLIFEPKKTISEIINGQQRNKAAITQFASEIGIAPGIVVRAISF